MAAAAVGGAAGGLIGSAITAGVTASESKKARAFQKRVLQNQIQWRVHDLRRAGINPILAAGAGLGGGGAPAPVQPNIPDFGSSAVSGARAGADAARAKEDVRQRRTQAELNSAAAAAQAATANNQNAQADKARAGIATEYANQAMMNAAANYSANNAEVARMNAEILARQLPQADALAEMWDDPAMKRVMQFKNLLSGSMFFSRPNSRPGQVPQRGPRSSSDAPPRPRRRMQPIPFRR